MSDTHNPQPHSVENTGSARSSHHGSETSAPQAEAQAEKYSVLAIVSFASAFFFSIAAIVCGHIALSEINKTGERGRGLALAGTVIGYVGFGVSVVAFIAFLALLPILIKTAIQNGTLNSECFTPTYRRNSQWIPAT